MDTGENGMSDIKRYDFSICPNHEIGCGECGYEENEIGDYVLYSDHIEAVVLKDARIDWVVKDNAKKAIEKTTMREALERIIGSVGDNGIEARNKARVALEKDDEG